MTKIREKQIFYPIFNNSIYTLKVKLNSNWLMKISSKIVYTIKKIVFC